MRTAERGKPGRTIACRIAMGAGLLLLAGAVSACGRSGGLPGVEPAAGGPAVSAVTPDSKPSDIYALGRQYEEGEGVVRDLERAVALYQEADRRGYPPASERLGILAARGEIEADPAVTRDRLNMALLRNRADGSLELARQLLDSRERTAADVDRAIGILRDLSNQGEVGAKLALARVYSDPLYGRPDFAAAERLYEQVYEAGDQRAAFEMARMFADETTPVYRPEQARLWALVAAAAGEPRGWLVIGRGQSDPASPDYDPGAAENAFRGAVDANVPGAKRDLAKFLGDQGRMAEAWQIYEELLVAGDDPVIAYDAARMIDDGGFTDRAQAYPLFLTALDAGQQSAVPRLLGLLEDDVGTPVIQATALDAVALHADREQDPEALGRVANLYLQGRGGAESGQALAYLERAVDLGNVEAAGRAARLLRDGGPGVAPNPAAAARFFQIAARGGSMDALVNVGRMHEQSGAVDQAVAAYQQALNAGATEAAARLYRLVRDNPGVSLDMAPVIAGLESAAAAGDTDAMVTLGDIASDPVSGGENYGDALAWYQRAAEAGDAVAHRRLGDLANAGRAGLSPGQAQAFYEQALSSGDTGAGVRVARTLLEGVPDQSQIAQALELTAPEARAGTPGGQYWHGVAQRFAGNYRESLDWLMRAYQAGEERALDQMVTTATEGGAQGGIDLGAQFADRLNQGSACERAAWHTLLGDMAARGAAPAQQARAYYLQAMQLGDPNAAAAMGRLHVTGIGLDQPDLAAAQVYLTMASEAGVAGVEDNLANLDAVMSAAERDRVADIAAELRSQMESPCQ